MAITVKSVTTNGTSNSGVTTISVTTPSASVGDLLVIIVGNDFYSEASLTLTGTSPTTTATEITSFDADGGTSTTNPTAHIKAWWAPVTTGGAVTVTADTAHSDEEKGLVVYILSGADTVSPIDDAAHGTYNSTAATPVVMPSVSPAGTTDLLICHAQTDGNANTTTSTAPGGISNAYDQAEGTLSRAIGGSEILSASGATGTLSWTPSNNLSYISASMAIKASSGASANTATIAWIV